MDRVKISVGHNRDNNRKETNLLNIINIVKQETNKNITKTERDSIWTTLNGKWEGILFFDLDIKLDIEEIKKIKEKLYQGLKQYHWFAAIAISTSGRGVHIYTKITADTSKKFRYNEYYKNYIAKTYVVENLLSEIKTEMYGNKYDNCNWIDKVNQSFNCNLFITADKDIKINFKFQDKPFDEREITKTAAEKYQNSEIINLKKIAHEYLS